VNELPKGWVETAFGALFEIKGGGTPSTKTPEYWTGEIPWISSANIDGSNQISIEKNISKTAIAKSTTNLVPADSVIVVTRVGLGKVALAETPMCFSQDMQALLPTNCVNKFYLKYYTGFVAKRFSSIAQGTTINGITKNTLKNTVFFLPPLAEQKRIVEKIEALFSRLDAGIAALEKTLSLSDKYIASVLKYAYGDFITKTDSAKYEALSLHVEQFQNGLAKRTGKEGSEHVVLRLADIKDYMFTKEKSRLIVLTDKEKEKYALNTNDLVFIRVNGSPDLVAKIILANGSEGFAFCDHFIRAKLKNSLLSEYLMYFGRTQDYRDYIKFNMVSTAGQHTISQTPLGSVKVPITSKEMQRKVINFIEEKLSLIEKQKYEIYAQLKKAQALKSKILEYAFTGKLVPQNPDDEPSEVLLERIKAEKEASQSTKKTRKRK